MLDAETLISLLKLTPLPAEGGYYRESYRSGDIVAGKYLGTRYSGERALATAIYYLITPDAYSRLHRVASDELFHFYLGDPVRMLNLHPDGSGEEILLGQNLAGGERVQHLVPHSTWQGTKLVTGGRFALLGTTVSPGFEFADFTAGLREALEKEYPAFAEKIGELC